MLITAATIAAHAAIQPACLELLVASNADAGVRLSPLQSARNRAPAAVVERYREGFQQASRGWCR